MKTLFIDPACPKSYSASTLLTSPIGGTEATVIRVAEALPDSVVMQHCRNASIDNYVRPDWNIGANAGAIVVLRCSDTAIATKQRFPSRMVYLWLHDLTGKQEARNTPKLAHMGIEVVCVSNFHRSQYLDSIKTHMPDLIVAPKIHVIYNPIDDALGPDQTPVNPNKLLFFSSPHKGLVYALETFQTLREQWHPELELHVANPGYVPLPALDIPGVKVLDSLPHAQMMQHVREAFCVWYPNHVFAETFGLVFAEANAVGTPVLTHPLGAAREVLADSCQIVDTKDRTKLFDRFNSWWPGNRPAVSGNADFKLGKVVQQWQTLLR